jgi:hypothetical protein
MAKRPGNPISAPNHLSPSCSFIENSSAFCLDSPLFLRLPLVRLTHTTRLLWQHLIRSRRLAGPLNESSVSPAVRRSPRIGMRAMYNPNSNTLWQDRGRACLGVRHLNVRNAVLFASADAHDHAVCHVKKCSSNDKRHGKPIAYAFAISQFADTAQWHIGRPFFISIVMEHAHCF